MNHAMTINVPDEVYQPLVARAEAIGQPPETVAVQLVAQSLGAVKPGSLLLRWVGAIQSDVSDAAERHDEYIGQRLHDELRGQ